MYVYNLSTFILLITFGDIVKSDEDILVPLPNMTIRGHVLKSENGNDYYAFQEIPYANAQDRKTRFKMPFWTVVHNGIVDTKENTIICWQQNSSWGKVYVAEYCQVLNVYTPMKPGLNKKLPVLVWFHGGSYLGGSGIYQRYGPKYLMDHGIVVVTINYRLGAFGFLTAEDEVVHTNLALYDQRWTLQWVNSNIELFNGDPNMVTLGGEDVGAASVGLHLLGEWEEDEKDLFQAVIMESGSPLWNDYYSNGAAREAFLKLVYTLYPGMDSNNTADMYKFLVTFTAEDIVKTAPEVGVHIGPIIEKNGTFSHQMLKSLTTGNFKKIPTMIGFTSEEMIYYGLYTDLEENAFKYDIDPSLFLSGFNISDENKTAAGQLLYDVYTKTSFREHLSSYIRFKSDIDFSIPLTIQAELQSNYSDVYLYQFAYKGKLGGLMFLPEIPDAERVGHDENLRYMWDDGTNSDPSQFSENDKLMLHRHIKLITNFVKYRNPTPEKSPLLQNISWPTVNPRDPNNIHYLNINETMEIRTNPRYYQEVKDIFKTYVFPYYLERFDNETHNNR